MELKNGKCNCRLADAKLFHHDAKFFYPCLYARLIIFCCWVLIILLYPHLHIISLSMHLFLSPYCQIHHFHLLSLPVLLWLAYCSFVIFFFECFQNFQPITEETQLLYDYCFFSHCSIAEQAINYIRAFFKKQLILALKVENHYTISTSVFSAWAYHKQWSVFPSI